MANYPRYPSGRIRLRSGAHVAIEALAIVADLLDDGVGPVLPEPERGAHARGDAEQAPNVRILAGQHGVDIARRDAPLFRFDRRELRPPDDVEPLIVSVADSRRQRLLGDEFRKKDVLLGPR